MVKVGGLGMVYSSDMKECVVSFIEGGGTKKEASRLFKVSERTIFYWLLRKKERGTLANKVRVTRPRKVEDEELRAYVAKHPDHYLWEIGEAFKMSPSGIFRALKRLRITYKKKSRSTRSGMKG